MISRNQKKVIFTMHFIEKALLKGVFDECGFEEGKKLTKNALKSFGLIIPDKERESNEFKCIFSLPNKKLVTVPIVDDNDNLIAKTIFPSQQPDIYEYEKAVKSKDLKREK